MKLIVGLGNPGEKYEKTRHNIGFAALNALLEEFEPLKKTFWDEESNPQAFLKKQKKAQAVVKKVNVDGQEIMLAKPETFMNNSGFAVSHLLYFYKIKPSDLIIVHDDSDLPLGKIRVRFGGASGGHRGVQSIIETIGTDKFLRIRLGIGRPGDERFGKEKRAGLDKYVLSVFGPSDKNKVKHMINETIKVINLILKHGLEKYMGKYNK